jgi:hypothetical protein
LALFLPLCLGYSTETMKETPIARSAFYISRLRLRRFPDIAAKGTVLTHHPGTGSRPRTPALQSTEISGSFRSFQAAPFSQGNLPFLSPPHINRFQFCLPLFKGQRQLLQLPLQRHERILAGMMTLLPLGAISKPFLPLKKRQSGRTIPFPSSHFKTAQPKG